MTRKLLAHAEAKKLVRAGRLPEDFYAELEDRFRKLDEETEHRVKARLKELIEQYSAALDERSPIAGHIERIQALTEELQKVDNLTPIREWRGWYQETALKHFHKHYAGLPLDERPFTDEVRAANPQFYHALQRQQSRAGCSINDLFPRRPDPEGGRLRLTPDEALAKDNERRARARARMRAQRGKQPAGGTKPV